MRRLAIALAIAAALAGGACSSKDKADEGAGDVKVTACKADPGGGKPTAEGTIHNGSSKDSSYAFHVAFKDGDGNKVSDGAVTVAKVDAGEDATWDATGASSAKGELSCEIDGLARTAVP